MRLSGAKLVLTALPATADKVGWPAARFLAARKPHLVAARGLVLIESDSRVLFARTTDLVQKLQVARRDLALEAAIDKLDKYHLLILDDLAFVAKDQAETSVLFELISDTKDAPFSSRKSTVWRVGKIFPGEAMTLAAIDRLVHHATNFEINVDSYRRKAVIKKISRSRPDPPDACCLLKRLISPRFWSIHQMEQNTNILIFPSAGLAPCGLVEGGPSHGDAKPLRKRNNYAPRST